MLLHSEEGQTRGPASRGSSAGGPGAFAADQGWSSTSPTPSSPSSIASRWPMRSTCAKVFFGGFRWSHLLHLMSCWAQGRGHIWRVHLWKHMDTCSIRYKGYREMCFVCCNIWIERAGQKEPLDTAPQGLIPWLFLVSGGGRVHRGGAARQISLKCVNETRVDCLPR
jgi:hypothetical protein